VGIIVKFVPKAPENSKKSRQTSKKRLTGETAADTAVSGVIFIQIR
jgi:hypothetical protein